MDPITHTMAGAAIATAGWTRRTALAVPTGMLAANAPDIDVLAYVRGEYAALAFRRGWTHGPLGLVVLSAVVVAIVLLVDGARRRRDPAAVPARAGPLLLLAAMAMATHPLLDWMNTYGVRWLMPFDRQWYYGDALFIIDPWLWLVLGVPLFLHYSTGRRAVIRWGVLAAVASLIVLGSGMVPPAAQVLWVAALAAAGVFRGLRGPAKRPDRVRRLAAASLALASCYVAGMVIADRAAVAAVRAEAGRIGLTPHRIMVAPQPADPFRAGVVIDLGDRYRIGTFDWNESPRVRWRSGTVERGEWDAVVAAGTAVPEARDYLRWSRFPLVRVGTDDDGHTVRFRDARYIDGPGAGSLAGVTVRVGTRPDGGRGAVGSSP